jgi:hypothetical protein
MPNNSSDNFHLLVEGVKRYISLNKDYARLELVEKLTILLSTFLLITTLIILGTGTLFYDSITICTLKKDSNDREELA